MDYQNDVTVIKEVVYYKELHNLIDNIACVNAYNANYNNINNINK